jgi:glycosyltransferase involved in cell wall biosynthesis
MTRVTRTAPVAVIVLAHNEEQNLEACLASVDGWVEQLFVVDSGSTDATLEIARRFGATVLTHEFESHARQWQWALEHADPSSLWVLGLDADQRVSPGLRDAMITTLGQTPAAPAGYFLNRRQIFRGRWIRHGGYYPKYLLKLFRRGAATVDAGDLVDHHFRVHGSTARLPGDLIEDNRNEADIAAWIAKHNRYARQQALQEHREVARGDGAGPASAFGDPDARVRWQKRIWRRLPLFVRPALYFVYRYVLRLGFLDGREGFIFHFLQGFWYRLLVDINLLELRQGHLHSDAVAPPPVVAPVARERVHDVRA